MNIENPFMQLIIGLIFGLCFIVGIVLLEHEDKANKPQCVMTKLSNSSLIICTYKDKVLFNGEINETQKVR